MNRYTQSRRAIWSSPWGIAGLMVLLLLTAHSAHVLAVLPLAAFLLCPLMHLFMMREMHGGHEGDADSGAEKGR